MADVDARLLLDTKCELGEGPAWDARAQRLIWVNILGKQVHVYDPATNEDRVYPTPQYVGVAVPRKSSGLVMALQDHFAAMDLNRGKVTSLAQLPQPERPKNRFNDGKCDPAGRFWAGTCSMEGLDHAANLYFVDRDRKVHRKLDRVRLSNGMAWTKDAKTMYYIDSRDHAVAAFDYDVETGDIRNRRVAFEVPKDNGTPDGMTIDTDGMLWIAHWGGYRVQRWDPKTGKVIKIIRTPASQTSSCAFGGPKLDKLYITSAWEGMNERTRAEQPLSGGLFVCENPGATGYPAVEFAG